MLRFPPEPPSVMFESGINRGLVEDAVRFNDPAAVSASRTVKLKPPVVSSLIVCGGIKEMVGSTLTEDRTVSTKLRTTAASPPPPPSDTITDIVAVPLELLAGRNESVPVVLGLV